MSPDKILEKYRNLVWPVVKSYLVTPEFPKPFAIDPKYKKMEKLYWKIVSEYPERKGKYIRPTLVLLSAIAMGQKANRIKNVAAAMQLSEDWILIHDDWEDKSHQRRGAPTLHKMYSDELAVNAGDGLHAVMWKAFFDTQKILGEDTTLKLLDEFYRQLIRTTMGQSTEIYWSQKNVFSFSDSDWFFIADGKTSYYTIACPMRLGGIVAEATDKQLELLAEFGVYLGRCFQLVDDILDVTSDFSGLKEMGNDIYEGKKTLILGHLLRRANQKDMVKLHKILGKSRENKTEAEVSWVIERMKHYKSIEYAQKKAADYKKKAMKMFETKLKFLKREPARTSLKTLINFMLERKY